MVVEPYLIDSPLPQEAIDRLVLSVAGEEFPLNGEDVSFFGYYFNWDEPDLTWAENDEIDIELIEAPVTATFDAGSYNGYEGDTVEVTVTLGGSFETRTVTLPIKAAGSGSATDSDYSGVPENLVFAPGETEKSFTVTLTDDDVDDDGESLTLSFGTESNIKSGGDHETATVSITDDDDPAVTVSFGAATYTAAEGSTATVTVSLSADPERTVEVPVTKTNQGGATAADYSGVPASVTFNSGRHREDDSRSRPPRTPTTMTGRA